jgi:hypothetical protein
MTLSQGLALLQQPSSPVIAAFKQAAAQRVAVKQAATKQALDPNSQALLGALLGGGLGTAYGYVQGDDEEPARDRWLRSLGYGLGGATLGGVGGHMLQQFAGADPAISDDRRGLSKAQIKENERLKIKQLYGVEPNQMSKAQAADYLARIQDTGSRTNQIHSVVTNPALGLAIPAAGSGLGALMGYRTPSLNPAAVPGIIEQQFQAGQLKGVPDPQFQAQQPGDKPRTVPPQPSRPMPAAQNKAVQLGRSLGYAWDADTAAWLSENAALDRRRTKDTPKALSGFRSRNPQGNHRAAKAKGLLGAATGVATMLGLGGLQGDMLRYTPLAWGPGSQATREHFGVAPTRAQAVKIIEEGLP